MFSFKLTEADDSISAVNIKLRNISVVAHEVAYVHGHEFLYSCHFDERDECS